MAFIHEGGGRFDGRNESAPERRRAGGARRQLSRVAKLLRFQADHSFLGTLV